MNIGEEKKVIEVVPLEVPVENPQTPEPATVPADVPAEPKVPAHA